ncbi:hypothetical protein ACWKSP_00525 [Micromonosporaceae bacterium Da 78-11]
MADIDVALKDAMQIQGAIGAALVDQDSGMTLGITGGSRDFDMTVAGAANTEVLRAKMRTMEMLGLSDSIEDILVTMSGQYHLIRPLTGKTGKGLFLYLALMKDRANLALARHQLKTIEGNLDL